MKAVALVLISASLAICATRPSDTFETSAAVKVPSIQHASLMIEAGGKVIQIDSVSDSQLPTADLILITDIHGDHMAQGAAKVKKNRHRGAEGGPQTVTADRRITARPKTIGWTIEAVPMYNLKRGPEPGKLFHDKGRGNGYVLTYGGKRFYISGDTEGIPEMRALKNIDVAFVCMNLPYTMTPEEAADAVKAFHPKVVYPYHYRGSDLAVFQKGLEGSGVEVRLRDWYAK